MTVSRPRVGGAWRAGRRLAFGGIALLLLSGALARGALALESAEPIPLVPPDQGEAQGGAKPAAAKPPAPAKAPASAEPSVEIGTLERVSPDVIGLKDQSEGGLPPGLWQGSRRQIVDRLIGRLPEVVASPTMRALALRLLLTRGQPPEGEAAAGAFFALRVETLAALGEYQLAGALVRAGPPDRVVALQARIDHELAFFRGGDFAAPCAQAADQVGRSPDLYWQKVAITCLLLNKDDEVARTRLDILRETSAAADPLFFALADRALGGSAKIESFASAAPLHVVLLRLVKATPPDDAIMNGNPAVLRMLAGIAELPIGLRIGVVERAETLGTVPADSLAKFYGAAPFTPEQLAKPLAQAKELTGPLRRALLFQAARNEKVPLVRAELLKAALAEARADSMFGSLARAAAPLIKALPLVPELGWFAGDGARALLAAGEADAARQWQALASQAATGGKPEAAAMAVEIGWLLALVTPEATALDVDALRGLLAKGDEAAVKARRKDVELLLSLLRALGRQVSEEAWQALLSDTTMSDAPAPAPAFAVLLDEAQAGGRLGETALFALALLKGGPAQTGAPALVRAVSALQAVSLAGEARALALEAALARGL